MTYEKIGTGGCKHYKYLPGQSYLPGFLTNPRDPAYDKEDRKRECMLRCLKAREDKPDDGYSNEAFILATEKWHRSYADRCQCVKSGYGQSCEDYKERYESKNLDTYRIVDTRLPTLQPTFAPELFPHMDYSEIGWGQCKKYKYLPPANSWLPAFLSDDRDPAYDKEDRKRECMLRCLRASDEYPSAGVSKVAFVVVTENYHVSYKDRCQCAKAGYSCEDYTERSTSGGGSDKRFKAYRIFDKRAPPTLKPTPAPKLYPHMSYTQIGEGWCKGRLYLPGQTWSPNFLTDTRDPRYSTDKKRECMLRCLQARDDFPLAGFGPAFFVMTDKYVSNPAHYKDRCVCSRGTCEKNEERTHNSGYMAYRIYDTRAAPTSRPTPAVLFPATSYSRLGYGYCENRVVLPGQNWHPDFIGQHVPANPLYSTDKKRECMLRCLEAHQHNPAVYSNLAFYVYSDSYPHAHYRGRCACTKAEDDCSDRVNNNNQYMAYKIVNSAAPTLQPTAVPTVDSSKMGYTLIGTGACKHTMYLPHQSSHPSLLTNTADPLYSTDKKRECMNRCLDAYSKAPNAYSKLAFHVLTENWHVSYKDMCQCVQADYSCEDWSERADNVNSEAYRIYDTRAPPTLKPTPAPQLYPHMDYTRIGYGPCKKYKYLPNIYGSTNHESGMQTVLSDSRDPRYNKEDRKRECMNRCLDAHEKDPSLETGYSDLAFYVATEHYHISYKDRCHCVQAGQSCEDYSDRGHATNKENRNYEAFRIYDTRAPPTLKPTPAPKTHPYLNYTRIGYGPCLKNKYLPEQSSLPAVLSDPRDPRFSLDRKRECIFGASRRATKIHWDTRTSHSLSRRSTTT
jgi:hypothetical protein